MSPETSHALSHQEQATPPPDEGTDRVVGIAMAWSVLAGTIHLVAAPHHLAEAWWVGAFFVGVGLGQLALAVLLWRTLPPSLVMAALVGQVAVIVLYVASRTVDLWFVPPHSYRHDMHLPVEGGIGNGIPVFPGDRVEPVGGLDLTCLVAELVVVVVLVSLLPERLRARASTVLAVLAAAAPVLLVLR